MSPTYEPDLVHATVDLLVDGEHGVWHVANEGALTGLDLARDAARRTGRADEGIIPEEGTRNTSCAARPGFSALSSRRARLVRSLDAALDAFSHASTSTRAEARSQPCVGEAIR